MLKKGKMTRSIALFMVFVFTAFLVPAVVTTNAYAAPPAGWNKLKDINILTGYRSEYEGWAGSGNGCLELDGYQLPLDNTVTYSGNTSFRVNVQWTADWWASDACTNLYWQTCNIEQYIANGRLEFYVRGNAGGEVFYVGLKDRVYERASGEFGEYVVPSSNYVTVTTGWKAVSIPLADIVGGTGFDPTQLYTFVVKNYNQNPMKFWISNIRITSPDTEKNYPAIKVNQLGYVNDADKYALVSFFEGRYSVGAGTTFYLKRKSDNATVYTGSLTLVSDYDQYVSGEKVLKADFTSYTTPGEYYVQVSGIPENSPSFKIGDKTLYNELLKDAAKYFYFQRANIALLPAYAGNYDHPAWHTDDASCPLLSNMSGPKRDVSGGWYDAGDFGKYVNAVAPSVSDLLWAYKLYPSLFPDNHLNIPESGNGIPDILDEVKYELDFLLKMQDPASGGFYAYVWPQNDYSAPRYIADITDTVSSNARPTSCTANAAGILAFAYTVFKDIDLNYANTLLAAAEHGWSYLAANPNPIETPNGPYDDGFNDKEDRFYAAASLYMATGKSVYNNYVKANYTQFASRFDNPENGHHCGTMEFVGFLNYMSSANPDAAVASWWTTKFQSWRNAIITRAQNNIWQNTLDASTMGGDYYWGSNGASLNSLVLVVIGSKLLGDYGSTQLKVVQNNMNYILGVNPLRHSYVTGYGEDCKQYPFSNIYSQDGKQGVPKGYMAGGANYYEGNVFSRFPGKCYSDRFTEFSTNEHTIYWNSLLVFNTAAIAGGLAAADTEAPSVPTDLVATPVSGSQINLSWTASTDNVGVAGYRIYRDGQEIGTSSGTSFSSTNLSPGTQYTYRVSAYDAAGNESAQSDPASATTFMIMGYNGEGSTSTAPGSNRMTAFRYQAPADMDVSRLHIKIATNANAKIKCAIYSDNNGNPGSLLKYTNELTNPGTGWKSFNLTSTQTLVGGSYYWIVVWCNSGTFRISSVSASGAGKYRTQTYGSWPSSFGTPAGNVNYRYCFYAEGEPAAGQTEVTVECESGERTNWSIVNQAGASGGQGVRATAASNHLTLMVNVPYSGTYRLYISNSHGVGGWPRTTQIDVDSTQNVWQGTLPENTGGGWETFRLTDLGTAYLTAGSHVFKIRHDYYDGYEHIYDFIRIVKQ